jgi:hypothetical protein
MGIESTIVLRDICGLGSEKILQIQHWAARTLTQAIAPS